MLFLALHVLRQEMPGQGFVSTSVCKVAAALVAAVEAAFAQGADTLLVERAGRVKWNCVLATRHLF